MSVGIGNKRVAKMIAAHGLLHGPISRSEVHIARIRHDLRPMFAPIHVLVERHPMARSESDRPLDLLRRGS